MKPTQHRLSNGMIEVIIDIEHGGRITSLSFVHGDNFLYSTKNSKVGNWNNYGGDFLWIAPQDVWGWPPIKAFDQAQWSALYSETLVLTSPSWQGVVLEREFDIIGMDTLQVVNRIKNVSEKIIQWGLWNITQIPLNDLYVTFEGLGLKVFKNEHNLNLEEIQSKGGLEIKKNKYSIKADNLLEYKIGVIAKNPRIILEKENLRLIKYLDEIVEKNPIWPHGTNLEIYKNDQYLEAEFVWPMVSLMPAEEYVGTEYFVLERIA